jgi:arginine deiminase
MNADTNVEHTIREWHETRAERDKLATKLEAALARIKALEEGLKTANDALKNSQEELKNYMRVAIEAVVANNDAAAILAASVSMADQFTRGRAGVPHDEKPRDDALETLTRELRAHGGER